jgi:TetR/AcrR family transcriptional repressor of nem operon
MVTKGRRTREHIIASSAPIFNVKGFAGCSIADILEATGLEKGGLYRHFASKDELALAAFDYAVNVLETRRTAAEAKATTAFGRLRAYVDTVAASIEHPPLPGGCPILNTAIDADDTHAQLRRRAATAMRKWQARLADAVHDAIASGELRPDVDAVATASILTSSLEGAIMITALLREPAQMKRVASHLHAFLESLRPRAVRRPRSAVAR